MTKNELKAQLDKLEVKYKPDALEKELRVLLEDALNTKAIKVDETIKDIIVEIVEKPVDEDGIAEIEKVKEEKEEKPVSVVSDEAAKILAEPVYKVYTALRPIKQNGIMYLRDQEIPCSIDQALALLTVKAIRR